mgnify:CR=1 FL=1
MCAEAGAQQRRHRHRRRRGRRNSKPTERATADRSCVVHDPCLWQAHQQSGGHAGEAVFTRLTSSLQSNCLVLACCRRPRTPGGGCRGCRSAKGLPLHAGPHHGMV